MTRPIFTAAFWADAGERALSTAAQAAVAVIGVDALVSIAAIDWPEVGGIAATAAALSILKSLIAVNVGAPDASLVPAGKHVA